MGSRANGLHRYIYNIFYIYYIYIHILCIYEIRTTVYKIIKIRNLRGLLRQGFPDCILKYGLENDIGTYRN